MSDSESGEPNSTLDDDSPMNAYDFNLARHLVGKALVEHDEIDIESYSREELGTVFWSESGSISMEVYRNHPDEYDPENEYTEDRGRRIIKHVIGKTLVEHDRVNLEDFSNNQIETVLWAVLGEVTAGEYVSHPDTRDLYKNHPKNDGD